MFNCDELEKIFHKNVPFIDDGLYYGTRRTMLKHAKTAWATRLDVMNVRYNEEFAEYEADKVFVSRLESFEFPETTDGDERIFIKVLQDRWEKFVEEVKKEIGWV